jgi:VCBS repeat-containing protein
VLVDADIVLTDPDDTNLTSATFRLTNAQAGDSLVVSGALPPGITATITANELALTGAATVADYRAALQQIAFSNSSEAPDTSDRIILVTIGDEAATSSAFALVHVVALDDPPVAQDGSASGTEGTPVGGTLVATDVDSASLTYRLGTQAAHGAVVINPDGTFTYTPNQDFFGTDSFTFLANDGAADSNAATVSLTVNPVNDPPVLDLDADDSTSGGTGYATTYVEGGAAVRIADTDIAISASALVSATITLTNPLPGDLLSVNGRCRAASPPSTIRPPV